jgi:hypothetical protein
MYHAPFMAFFSPGFYRDVGAHWRGAVFGYLLLLLAICWVPDFVQFQLFVGDYVENKAPALISQIPPIRIIKGQVFVDVVQPYEIIAPDSGKVLALIDTTGAKTSLEGTEAQALLTRTEVIFRESGVETRTISLKRVERFTLDRERVWGWLTIFNRFCAIVTFPLAVIGSFAFRIMQALLCAAIGLLFAKWCKTSTSYGTLLRLSVMAVTPVIIAGTIVEMARVKVPFHNLLYFAAAIGYLFLGVKAISRRAEVPVIDHDDQGAPSDADQL